MFLCQISFGQELSAKVVDENNEPLIGATVYFDRTTIGVITNMEGIFTIQKPAYLDNQTLVITFMGYESIYIKDLQNIQNVYKLKPRSVKLDAVTLYDSPFEREDMLEMFKLYFIGEGKEARQCEILNINDVVVYYRVKNNTLYATSDNPIIVQNKYLGYKVFFDLKSFEIKFAITSIDEELVKESFYAGTSYFKDTNPTRGRLRDKVYDGSLNYFLKSLVENKIFETNFFVAYDGNIINPKKAFDIKPLDEETFQITLKSRVYETKNGEFVPTKIIITHRYDMSNILFLKPVIRVDKFGNNLDIDNIRLLGELSKYRIARMLPTNFLPSKN